MMNPMITLHSPYRENLPCLDLDVHILKMTKLKSEAWHVLEIMGDKLKSMETNSNCVKYILAKMVNNLKLITGKMGLRECRPRRLPASPEA